MGFFDNLSEKITAGGNKVAEKAKEGYELASLQATIEKEKVVQEKLYNEIGKKFYAEYRDILAEKLPEDTAKIDESIKRADDAKEALRNKKGNVVCPGCGKEVAKGTKFCPACGAVMPEDVQEETAEEAPAEAEEANAVKVCPGCGEPVEDGAQFCSKCGAKITE